MSRTEPVEFSDLKRLLRENPVYSALTPLVEVADGNIISVNLLYKVGQWSLRWDKRRFCVMVTPRSWRVDPLNDSTIFSDTYTLAIYVWMNGVSAPLQHKLLACDSTRFEEAPIALDLLTTNSGWQYTSLIAKGLSLRNISDRVRLLRLPITSLLPIDLSLMT